MEIPPYDRLVGKLTSQCGTSVPRIDDSDKKVRAIEVDLLGFSDVPSFTIDCDV